LWTIATVIPILRNFVTVLDNLNHPTFELSEFCRSFPQCRSFCPQLFRTPKLMFSDFVGLGILRCQNLVGTGFIRGRPFFVSVGEC